MTSERAQELDSSDDPWVQLGVVQESLRVNDDNIARVEDIWATDPQNPALRAQHERLAKKEQLLLEERKIWAGASLQNHSWQAGFNSSVGFKELLKRMAAAATSGETHDLMNFDRQRHRNRPPAKQARANSRLPLPATHDPLDLLCDAAEHTESFGHGASEWRGTNPQQYLPPYIRDSQAGRRAMSGSPIRPAKQRRQHAASRYSSLWEGSGEDVKVVLNLDQWLADYVRGKLMQGADESCTEREPLGLDPSLSDDFKPGQSFLSQSLKDQDYGGAASGGTRMSQQGNLTPGRSDNGAVNMPINNFEVPNYGRNGFMDYPVVARQKPETSEQSGRLMQQDTQLPSRYDENQFVMHPP